MRNESLSTGGIWPEQKHVETFCLTSCSVLVSSCFYGLNTETLEVIAVFDGMNHGVVKSTWADFEWFWMILRFFLMVCYLGFWWLLNLWSWLKLDWSYWGLGGLLRDSQVVDIRWLMVKCSMVEVPGGYSGFFRWLILMSAFAWPLILIRFRHIINHFQSLCSSFDHSYLSSKLFQEDLQAALYTRRLHGKEQNDSIWQLLQKLLPQINPRNEAPCNRLRREHWAATKPMYQWKQSLHYICLSKPCIKIKHKPFNQSNITTMYCIHIWQWIKK